MSHARIPVPTQGTLRYPCVNYLIAGERQYREDGPGRILLFWPTIVTHTIDQSSTLYYLHPTDLTIHNQSFEIIFVLEGIVEATGCLCYAGAYILYTLGVPLGATLWGLKLEKGERQWQKGGGFFQISWDLSGDYDNIKCGWNGLCWQPALTDDSARLVIMKHNARLPYDKNKFYPPHFS